MKQLLSLFLSVSCLFGICYADVEDDAHAIVTSFLDQELDQQIYLSFASMALEQSDRKMDVSELATLLKECMYSKETMEKLTPFFEKQFSEEELRIVRLIQENHAFMKYKKSLSVFNSTLLSEMQTVLATLIDEHADNSEEASLVFAVTEDTFAEEVLESNCPVIVDIYAEWCPPCRNMKPIYDQLSKENPGIKFVTLNCDENRLIPQRYRVEGLPTFLFFENGELVGRHVGFISQEGFQKKIDEFLR